MSKAGDFILTSHQIGVLDDLNRRAESITMVTFNQLTGDLYITYHDENRAETIVVNFAGRILETTP
jgi:hypothetical protein